jgi:hypothetical protein
MTEINLPSLLIDIVVNNVICYLPYSEKHTFSCLNKFYKNNIENIPMEDWGFVEFSQKEIKKLEPWNGTELFVSKKNKTLVVKEGQNNPEFTAFTTLTEPTIIFKMIKSGHFSNPTFPYSNMIKGLQWTILRRSIPDNYQSLINNVSAQRLVSSNDILIVFSSEERKINLQLAFDVFSSSKQLSTIKQLQFLIQSNNICKKTVYIPQTLSPAEILTIFHYQQFYIPNFLRAYENLNNFVLYEQDSRDVSKDIINVIFKVNTDGSLWKDSNDTYILPAYSAFNYETMSLENNVLIITLNQINQVIPHREKKDDEFLTWLSKKGELCRNRFYSCVNLFERTNSFISNYYRNSID